MKKSKYDWQINSERRSETGTWEKEYTHPKRTSNYKIGYDTTRPEKRYYVYKISKKTGFFKYKNFQSGEKAQEFLHKQMYPTKKVKEK